MKQLVFVHGRAQEHKDAVALKAEWVATLTRGLAKSGLAMPAAESEIRFPFYGDTLFDLVKNKPAGQVADVIVRGADNDAGQRAFFAEMAREVQQFAGITEEQVDELLGDDVVTRGPANWEWVQAILKGVDRFIPGGSGAGIALATNDVYQFLNNAAIREKIEAGVAAAMTPGVETVVVSHSLGTVVAYDLLRREGKLRGWKVPLFVTVGSPLGVKAIRKKMAGMATLARPECAAAWFNAMDERDVVALYPLTSANFPIDPKIPEIRNKTDVRNETPNRHGIEGYLDDAEVAGAIYRALTA